MIKQAIILGLAIVALTGCDQVAGKLGIENPAVKEAKTDAEGKAVGSACRHSGRAIEDCYAIYSWLPKSSVYAGWREMDEYMRENKLETIVPQLPPPEPPGSKRKRPTPEPVSTDAGTETAAPPAAAEAPAAADTPAAEGK
jgi:hypothetical protein